MSRRDGLTAGGAAKRGPGPDDHMNRRGETGKGRRTGVPAAGGTLMRQPTGRFAGAAAAAAMAVLMGSGALAAPDATRLSSARTEVREVQIAAINRKDGRIMVEDEPLLRVIDELNRHSKHKVKVDRSDRRYRRLLVTGQFRTGRASVIIQYMRAAGLKVRVRRDEGGNFVLSLPPEPTQG
ncbi:MAG: hypothetical protein ACLFV8_09920 [Alphaproteobacteria bacterium]